VSLISPWRSTLRITFSAVNWSAAIGLERNFAFLAAISTNCLMHLSSSHFLLNSFYYIVQNIALLAQQHYFRTHIKAYSRIRMILMDC
jgi:hypothetical protein